MGPQQPLRIDQDLIPPAPLIYPLHYVMAFQPLLIVYSQLKLIYEKFLYMRKLIHILKNKAYL